ncbi:hypothetical protein OPV22_009788 [Ensete ventricosum]|uniref:Uncharacterized protein n=1 Tax=Ensete ventricosum TaxID=4639 RepID=A0AAV8RFU9_ENSVE|nr:hypothetical protein OPV22_009788 [Ensete ventricosum]
MERDALRMRDGGPFVFAQVKHRVGVEEIGAIDLDIIRNQKETNLEVIDIITTLSASLKSCNNKPKETNLELVSCGSLRGRTPSSVTPKSSSHKKPVLVSHGVCRQPEEAEDRTYTAVEDGNLTGPKAEMPHTRRLAVRSN